MTLIKKLTAIDNNQGLQHYGLPQSISGKVVNEFGEPLFGAHVFYESNISLGTHTDENGNFIIASLLNETNLIASYITSTVRVNLSQLQQNPLITINTALQGDEVVINASKGTLIIGFLIALIIIILSQLDNRKYNILNN